VVDVQRFIRERWPDLPNHTVGNECLVSTERSSKVLGYRPRAGGTYFHQDVIW
jgi:hypothetical protein